MFCGAGSFSHVDEDPWAPSMPKGSRRKQGSSNNNPYSTRGLDKFSTVLADLEERREKIMARAGSQGVSIVRFVYSNSQDWVPIVVRPRDPPPLEEKPKKAAAGEGPKKSSTDVVKEPTPTSIGTRNDGEVARAGPVSDQTAKKSCSSNLKECGDWIGGVLFGWRPSYYWPMVVVLILLCLVMFGRVFAICCTSIWWYLVPSMNGESRNNVRKPVKKKDYGRRLSDKKLGGGGGGGGGAVASAQAKTVKVGTLDGLASPRHHANAKRGSW